MFSDSDTDMFLRFIYVHIVYSSLVHLFLSIAYGSEVPDVIVFMGFLSFA